MTEDILEQYAKASGLRPRPGYWGFDFFEAFTGQGGIIWAASQAESLDLMRIYPAWLASSKAPDPAKVEGVSKIVDQVQAGLLDTKEAYQQINQVIGYGWTLTWWGWYEDLLDSDDSYASGIREGFWYSQNEEDDERTDPIPDDLEADFADWLVARY